MHGLKWPINSARIVAMDIRRQRALRGALELHSSEVDFDLVRPAGTAAVGEAAGKAATGAWSYNRPCAHQYVGKSQSCML